MQAVDLIHREGNSGDYAFKHALARDALYQSLLAEPRKLFHLKIAEELERRSGNRLNEVAEVLAHHYSQTESAEKAFAYLSMAGSKSLSVYSLDEAATHFTAALNLLDKKPDDDDEVDAHIQNWLRFVIGCEEFHRGRTAQAQEAARELLQIGQALHDPRSTGLGLHVLMWIALVSDSYNEALAYSEHSLATAIASLEVDGALVGKGCALIMLRRTKEGAAILAEGRRRCSVNGDLYALVGSDGVMGVSKVLDGHIAEGMRFIEGAIKTQEDKGYRAIADWYRLFLAEVYLQIISGQDRPPFPVLMKNLWTILKATVTGKSAVLTLMTSVLENPHFDPAGINIGRAKMVLGLLYKVRKDRTLATRYLIDAKQIFSQFGQTPILARVETALAELGQ